jgi:hypothetical protein
MTMRGRNAAHREERLLNDPSPQLPQSRLNGANAKELDDQTKVGEHIDSWKSAVRGRGWDRGGPPTAGCSAGAGSPAAAAADRRPGRARPRGGRWVGRDPRRRAAGCGIVHACPTHAEPPSADHQGHQTQDHLDQPGHAHHQQHLDHTGATTIDDQVEHANPATATAAPRWRARADAQHHRRRRQFGL